ncbi:uncharacterized protein [Mobula birostris]|uniref:uncharacterized protein n=1 Tax=Mobula birostris TaxID=1983395 RepID=UPI003B28A79D
MKRNSITQERSLHWLRIPHGSTLISMCPYGPPHLRRYSDRRLERDVTAKLRTLPSIRQSPTATRTHGHTLPKGQDDRGYNRPPLSPKAQEIGFGLDLDESWKRRRDTSEGVSKEGADQWHLRTSTSEPHVSSSRSCFLYMRKSVSVDEHLGWLECSHNSSGSRVKVKLRRKLSLGSANKKESLQERLESSKVRLAVRLRHKDRVDTVSEESPSWFHPRQRSLSLDCTSSLGPRCLDLALPCHVTTVLHLQGFSSRHTNARSYRRFKSSTSFAI